MLRGFALDMPPRFCFITKYVLPLYINIDFLHLSYGYRVPGGDLLTPRLWQHGVADAALAVIHAEFDFTDEEGSDDLLRMIPFLSAAGQSELMAAIHLLKTEDIDDLASRAAVNMKRLGIESAYVL
jgi:hypothetical protein